MQRSRGALLPAALAAIALLAGCGATTATETARAPHAPPTTSTSTKAQSTTTAYVGTGGGGVLPASLDLTKLKATLATQRFQHIRMTMDLNVDGRPQGTIAYTMTTDRENRAFQLDEAPDAAAGISGSAMRFVGGTLYMQPADATGWTKILSSAFEGKSNPVKKPTSLLDTLAAMGARLSRDGHVVRNGETLTRFRGPVDVATMMNKLRSGSKFSEQIFKKLPADAKTDAHAVVLLDASGAPKSMELSMHVVGPSKHGTKSVMVTERTTFLGTADVTPLAAPPAADIANTVHVNSAAEYEQEMKKLLSG